MSEEEANSIPGAATAHAAITAISVQIGRMDERLVSVKDSLDLHMRDEHKEFREALQKIEAVEHSVMEIHAAAKTTRIIAAIVAAAAGAWTWAADFIKLHR